MPKLFSARNLTPPHEKAAFMFLSIIFLFISLRALRLRARLVASRRFQGHTRLSCNSQKSLLASPVAQNLYAMTMRSYSLLCIPMASYGFLWISMRRLCRVYAPSIRILTQLLAVFRGNSTQPKSARTKNGRFAFYALFQMASVWFSRSRHTSAAGLRLVRIVN
jgi:hypothetical protein